MRGDALDVVNGMEAEVARTWHTCSFFEIWIGSTLSFTSESSPAIIVADWGEGHSYCEKVLVSTLGSTNTVEPSGKFIESTGIETDSPGNTVSEILDARHRMGLLLSGPSSHKRSGSEYDMISLPLMMISFFDGRSAMSLSSRNGSPAIISPISFRVTKASKLNTCEPRRILTFLTSPTTSSCDEESAWIAP